MNPKKICQIIGSILVWMVVILGLVPSVIQAADEGPESNQTAIPSGLEEVDCSDYYQFGSVDAHLRVSAGKHEALPGEEYPVDVILKNNNDYPIVEGSVYIKVYKEQTNLEGAWQNGDLVIDQFMLPDKVTLNAGESKTLNFKWKIPANLLTGEYRMNSFVQAAKKFNLLGLTFTDDVLGNSLNFKVNNPSVLAGVEFDKNNVQVNGGAFNFIGFLDPKEADKELIVEAPLVNKTNRDQQVKVTWELYSWDGLLEENKLDAIEETVNLSPGATNRLTYTIKPNDKPVNYLTVTAYYEDTKSILNLRFARDGVETVRINFPAVTSFPLKEGQPATVFMCAHAVKSVTALSNFDPYYVNDEVWNSMTAEEQELLRRSKERYNELRGIKSDAAVNSTQVPSHTLTLQIKDAKGKVVEEFSGDAVLGGPMQGFKKEFTASRDLDKFQVVAVITAEDGKVIDEAQMSYDCEEIDPALCAKKTGLFSGGDGTANNLVGLMMVVIAVIIVVLIFLLIKHKRENSTMLKSIIFFLLFSAALMISVFLTGASEARAAEASAKVTAPERMVMKIDEFNNVCPSDGMVFECSNIPSECKEGGECSRWGSLGGGGENGSNCDNGGLGCFCQAYEVTDCDLNASAGTFAELYMFDPPNAQCAKVEGKCSKDFIKLFERINVTPYYGLGPVDKINYSSQSYADAGFAVSNEGAAISPGDQFYLEIHHSGSWDNQGWHNDTPPINWQTDHSKEKKYWDIEHWRLDRGKTIDINATHIFFPPPVEEIISQIGGKTGVIDWKDEGFREDENGEAFRRIAVKVKETAPEGALTLTIRLGNTTGKVYYKNLVTYDYYFGTYDWGSLNGKTVVVAEESTKDGPWFFKVKGCHVNVNGGDAGYVDCGSNNPYICDWRGGGWNCGDPGDPNKDAEILVGPALLTHHYTVGPPTPQDGVCGIAENDPPSSTPPTNNLCAVGPVWEERVKEDNPDKWYWYCDGVNGGKRSRECHSPKPTPPTCSLNPDSVCEGKDTELTANITNKSLVSRFSWSCSPGSCSARDCSFDQGCFKAGGSDKFVFKAENVTGTNSARITLNMESAAGSGFCTGMIRIDKAACGFSITNATNLKIGDIIVLELNKNDCFSGSPNYEVKANNTKIDDHPDLTCTSCSGDTWKVRVDKAGSYDFTAEVAGVSCGGQNINVEAAENKWWER